MSKIRGIDGFGATGGGAATGQAANVSRAARGELVRTRTPVRKPSVKTRTPAKMPSNKKIVRKIATDYSKRSVGVAVSTKTPKKLEGFGKVRVFNKFKENGRLEVKGSMSKMRKQARLGTKNGVGRVRDYRTSVAGKTGAKNPLNKKGK